MNVPLLDLKAAHNEIRSELDAAFQRVLESGWYILGEELESFEQSFARFCGVPHCLGVANGLEALHLLLLAHGVGRGDEVIVPSNTYIATWLAISYVGARPVPVEPSPETFNIDAALLERAITSRTRAVIPVHLYGRIADMNAISSICKRKGLVIIEDCAQAHGAAQNGRMAGSFSSAAFSFYPSKNLGALGDAGAVTTHDADIAEKVRVLRNYGSRVRYYNEVVGFNSRLDPLQAAFLSAKLPLLNEWNARRARVAKRYSSELADVRHLTLPASSGDGENVWHQYVIRHPERDQLQKHLTKNGIGTLIHYPVPPHLSKAYEDCGWKRGDFPIAEKMADSVLSIPIGPHLSSDSVSAVVDAIRSFSP